MVVLLCSTLTLELDALGPQETDSDTEPEDEQHEDELDDGLRHIIPPQNRRG
jgi:hypothetical protein